MKKKTFTIFGHTGFIGSFFKNKLKHQNLILPKRNQFFLKKNLGHVIYCLGSDNWKKETYKSYYSNLGLLPDIVEKNQFSSFTYLSSIRIYNNSKSSNENTFIKLNPNITDDYYNIKKVCSESYLINSKKNTKIIRLANLYGENFFAPIMLPTFIRMAALNKLIHITINKNSLKDFLSIEDAADIILKIINSGSENIYNVASGQRIAIGQIAKKIQKITKCKIKLSNQKIRVDEKKINIDKIKKEFNFKTTSNVINSIDKLVNKFFSKKK